MGQALTGALDLLQNEIERGSDSGNAPTLLMLGSFKFSVNTAVFQQLEALYQYRWASIERIGKNNALQFTGYDDATISLPGTVYPDWKGDVYQVDQIRTLANQGVPLRLITGDGVVSGFWVITEIRDVRSFYKLDNTFRKQEFTIGLKYFGTDIS